MYSYMACVSEPELKEKRCHSILTEKVSHLIVLPSFFLS
jgi:hypothetical protein